MLRLPSRERTTDLRIRISPGEIGVSSAPVIDRDGRALYLPAKSKRIVRNKPHLPTLCARPIDWEGQAPKILDTIVNNLSKHDKATDVTFVTGRTAKGSGSGSVEPFYIPNAVEIPIPQVVIICKLPSHDITKINLGLQ